MEPKFKPGDIVRLNLTHGDSFDNGLTNYDLKLISQMDGFGIWNHSNHNCWYVRFIEGPLAGKGLAPYIASQKNLVLKKEYPKCASKLKEHNILPNI